MNLYVAICLLAVAASANADGALGLGGLGGLDGLVYAPGHASADYYAYPRYAFEYSVKDPHTGDNKAQWEKRDGDVVKGAYSLVEPDGSLRVVEYWADDKSGFNAVVKRLGPNLHPTTVHAAPIYKAPIPVLGHGPVVSPISIGSVANLGHLASAPLISGPIHGPALSTQNLIKEAVPIVKTVVPTPILPAPILPAPILPAPIHHAPYYGHSALLKEPVPIVKPILPVPLIREPIGHAPLLQAPIFPGPIYKSGPIYSKPLGPLPIYKEPLPLYKGELPLYRGELPLYKEALPLYKEARPLYKEPLPLYKEALPLPLLKGPVEVGPVGDWQVIGKGPVAPWGGLGKGPYGWEGLGKGPLIGDLGYGKGIGALGHLNPVSLGGHGLVKGPIGPLPYGPLPYEIIEKAPHVPAWNGPLESYPLYPGGYKH